MNRTSRFGLSYEYSNGGKMNQNGVWLSILEYASVHETSVSTIRRSIKSGQVKYKEENGKYFLWTEKIGVEKKNLAIQLENEFLKRRNKELQEEINDLKMLLSVYEAPITVALPPLPEVEL